MQNLPLSLRSSSIRIDDGDRRSLLSTTAATAATVGRQCRRQRRRSVAVVDDSGDGRDGRSPLSTTAATETAILLEEYSGSLTIHQDSPRSYNSIGSECCVETSMRKRETSPNKGDLLLE
ncbi:hypothetical protein Y032_0005g2331 [Ancylostoma ceylanicum]|uniref:Uncharacterized protein n=1 Tax=Ancylostoma ceylanicum TaxID=53326 RepID=A0A016VRG9_9BILA|nr:hypothetical protein Y032_0005g2331 [Ancylostoma ceylanicum]